MEYYVYIIKSSLDGRLYIGQTNDLKDRIQRHNAGRIKSTKSGRPFTLCYFEEFDTRREAMYREWEFKKKWNTDRKLKLIESFDRSKLTKYMGL